MPATNSDNGAGATWPLPAVQTKTGGTPRRVGIEFELQGLDVDELAAIVAATLDGTIRQHSDAEYTVTTPNNEEYRVEIDSALLKSNAAVKADKPDETSALQEAAFSAISSVGSLVVPCEVVSPPLAMADIAEPMDSLVAAIRAAGGQGTRQSPLYAFGVHLNIEPPTLEANQVVNYIKAFVCLYDWIVEAGDVDLTRQIMPYIRRFPTGYEDLVTAPGYAPDWRTMIDDYLAANPTRNRALDMLPMFAHMDADAVRDIVDDDLIKPRPAFHYRLANCCIDDPDWSIAAPWSRWLQIEQLALDEARLEECCDAFTRDRQRLLSKLDSQWREEVQQWLISF